jgi:hypothetical protein
VAFGVDPHDAVQVSQTTSAKSKTAFHFTFASERSGEKIIHSLSTGQASKKQTIKFYEPIFVEKSVFEFAGDCLNLYGVRIIHFQNERDGDQVWRLPSSDHG